MSVLIAKKQTEEEIMKFIKPVMAVMLLACLLHFLTSSLFCATT